jgi:hypothetical protein
VPATARLEIAPVVFDGCPELVDPLLAGRYRGDDRRLPGLGRASAGGTGRVEAEHAAQLHDDPLVAVEVCLVDDEDVGDLQDPPL